MNRPLKFRVWNKQTRDFLNDTPGTHGFSEYYLDLEGGGLVTFDGSISDEFESYTKGLKNDYYLDGTKIVKESPYVITQFTGLVDKNNIEIFEGDIVKSFAACDLDKKDLITAEVVFEDKFGWWGFNQGDDKEEFLWYEIRYDAEVIGNIFQNKELLNNE